MKRLKLTLAAITFFIPFCAFAHGEEVLVPVFGQLGSILAFLILLAVSKIESVSKLLLAAIYFLTLGLIVFATWNLSYRQNRTMLDFAMILGPVAATLTAFFFLKLRKKSGAE